MITSGGGYFGALRGCLRYFFLAAFSFCLDFIFFCCVLSKDKVPLWTHSSLHLPLQFCFKWCKSIRRSTCTVWSALTCFFQISNGMSLWPFKNVKWREFDPFIGTVSKSCCKTRNILAQTAGNKTPSRNDGNHVAFDWTTLLFLDLISNLLNFSLIARNSTAAYSWHARCSFELRSVEKLLSFSKFKP